jgi:aminoglycoside/choline kinase family phosphotransferase
MLNFRALKEIKGDASFRKFYRNKKNNSIIVFAKKEKVKNLLNYDAVNKILNRNKILAPKLLSQNFKKNYIEVEDFGDNTLYKLFKNKNVNKEKIFKKIIKLLIKLQSIKDKKITNFKNQQFKITEYNNETLLNEANLFCEWYTPTKLNRFKNKNFKKNYQKEVKKILLNLNFKNDTFVHRDFHVSNLMYFKNNIAIIDTQDALIGNKAYDLASLIDDVRFKTTNKFKNKILKYYLKNYEKKNLRKFINDFEILSILRNLKIIGIFMRLALRDNKKKYIKFIPYTWEMINHRMNGNREFKNLKLLLKQNFSKYVN